MDDLEFLGFQDFEDFRLKFEQEVGVGILGIVVVEQQYFVEFDFLDLGLFFFCNYFMVLGIQLSLDEGQSVGFEEEDGVGEEGFSGFGFVVYIFLEFQDFSQEKFFQVGELEVGEEFVVVCVVVYIIELLDIVVLNLYCIDKDVQRCDCNYWYFMFFNLERFRDVMCSYVWEYLDVGYVQGMCDLLVFFLVIFDNDQLVYSCFSYFMKRMSQNFFNGGVMDIYFVNMCFFIQILDLELFELMYQNGDYIYFYFCYCWFLLDFKRELLYEDVFVVWEVIWVVRYILLEYFVLFIVLVLVEVY